MCCSWGDGGNVGRQRGRIDRLPHQVLSFCWMIEIKMEIRSRCEMKLDRNAFESRTGRSICEVVCWTPDGIQQHPKTRSIRTLQPSPPSKISWHVLRARSSIANVTCTKSMTCCMSMSIGWSWNWIGSSWGTAAILQREQEFYWRLQRKQEESNYLIWSLCRWNELDYAKGIWDVKDGGNFGCEIWNGHFYGKSEWIFWRKRREKCHW